MHERQFFRPGSCPHEPYKPGIGMPKEPGDVTSIQSQGGQREIEKEQDLIFFYVQLQVMHLVLKH